MKSMDGAVARALEQVDADSWAELCAAVPREVAQTLKLSIERHGNVVSSFCLVNDAPLGNRAIAIGLGCDGQACSREQVFALKERFAATGMKNFALQLSPYAEPAELPQWLAEAGLVERGRWVKLLRGATAAPLLDSPVPVRRAEPGENLYFGQISAQGFGRPAIIAHWMGATVGFPRWHHYVAMIDGQPAGTAAMYVDGAHAWLGIGSTLPDFRARGVQSALIARRLAEGLALGVRYFVSETESRNVSCKNLLRAGFAVAYERPNFGLPLVEASGPA